MGAGAINVSNNNNLSLDYVTKESIYMYEKMAPEASLYGDYMLQKIVSAEWDGNTLVWLIEETLESFSDYFWENIYRSEEKGLKIELYWEQNKCE